MFTSLLITTVDTHTQGEPTRVVTSGIGPIPGSSMYARKKWLARNKDHIRRFLLWEPRGHQDMFGAIVTDPISPEADIGLLFMDSGGYLDMCGHGCMGSIAALIGTGAIPVDAQADKSEKHITVDTPSGLIKARALISRGLLEQVRVYPQPAFWHSAVDTSLAGHTIPVDIAYGGNFFGLVDAKQAGLRLEMDNLVQLKKAALALRHELNQHTRLMHPISNDPSQVALIEFYEEGQPAKNVVIFGSGQVDRSPCGTGTCAKMALLHKKGQLECGQSYIQQGILGTQFTGSIVQETTFGAMPAIMPEVTGKAFITGFHHFVAQPEDPFEFGFQLPN
ncbi:MAG: proline racemase family protein [Desulfovermiculus sp.]